MAGEHPASPGRQIRQPLLPAATRRTGRRRNATAEGSFRYHADRFSRSGARWRWCPWWSEPARRSPPSWARRRGRSCGAGLFPDLLPQRQRAVGAGADHQPAASPWNVLRGRERSVPVRTAEPPRCGLLALPDLPAAMTRSGPATISCPGAITGRAPVTAAADRLSGNQLALLSLGQMYHHQVAGGTDQLQHLVTRHGAVERDGVPVPLAEVVARPDHGMPATQAAVRSQTRSHVL
jgi:hypothetical protein